MKPNAANHELLEAWRQGDQCAAAELFRRYQFRLSAFVRSRLSRRLARRLDEEDVVLSAYRSFFLAARTGRIEPKEGGDLWPLLVTFALRKLTHQVRRHQAGKRDLRRDSEEETEELREAISGEPTAEQAAAVLDEIENWLERLDDQPRAVFERLLRGEDAATIASALGVHERTVRRTLERIRNEAAEREGRSFFAGSISRWTVAATASSPSSVFRETSAVGTFSDSELLLKRLIGTGGFSKVYLANHRASGQDVAVKFLRKESWNNVRAGEAMLREWDLLRQLSHPNILRVLGWGRARGGGLFLVNEYVEGVSLDRWQQQTSPRLSELVSAVRTIAEAVSACHSQGMLHCDLKPMNVLFENHVRIVLCDFGLARWLHSPDDVPRGGTAGFLAPEQISDLYGSLTVQTDVYGLGATLYALVCGRPPMTGTDLPETLSNVLSFRAPTSPNELRAEVPDGLSRFLLRCLSKEPAERPANAQQFLQELTNLAID